MQWDLGIAEGFELADPVLDAGSDSSDIGLGVPPAWNQFRGKFISQQTHTGLRLPPICSDSGREFRSIVAWLALPDFQSRAVGVGHIATAVLKFSPPSLPLFPGPPVPSL